MSNTRILVIAIFVLIALGVIWIILNKPSTKLPSQSDQHDLTILEQSQPFQKQAVADKKEPQIMELSELAALLELASDSEAQKAIQSPFAKVVRDQQLHEQLSRFADLAGKRAIFHDKQAKTPDLACIFRGMAEDVRKKQELLALPAKKGEQAHLWKELHALFIDVRLIEQAAVDGSQVRIWRGETCPAAH